jgi:hypothetical protein
VALVAPVVLGQHTPVQVGEDIPLLGVGAEDAAFLVQSQGVIRPPALADEVVNGRTCSVSDIILSFNIQLYFSFVFTYSCNIDV